ncbi:MAG: CBS domain-containing protein, partial [Alphaproteobacteria bacterium]|nr:CBS domain-containing protein [Alphaproteobacteria bacterium]
MKVHNMLKQKGGTVATIQPDAQISAAVKLLEAKGIGALVVSADGKAVDGIISERDIVRALAGQGGDLLAMPVDTIMTGNVVTCTPEDSLNHIMGEMTQRRFRHMPVVEDGVL